jgi:hypothetical protein
LASATMEPSIPAAPAPSEAATATKSARSPPTAASSLSASESYFSVPPPSAR